MSYVKHTWETGEVIDAEKLNNLETGVESAGGADWNATEGEDGFIENKPFETIGSGLTVEDGALKTTGGSGGRGADWDAEEGEDGFIENKPFESHIEDVPGLPHTYVDNMSLEASKNLVDELVKDIGPEEWEMYIGVPSNKCFCSTGLILNYTQAQGCYSFTHEGAPYPGDEAIIEEYGSVQAFGEAMAAAIVSFMYLSVPCTYIGNFNYTPGNLPDMKLLNNPVFTSKILDNELQDAPYTLLVNNISPTPEEPMFTTNAIDVWGNLGGMYNGIIGTVIGSPSIVASLYYEGISKPTSDKYYFAICTISYMGMYPIYWYDIAFADDKYFGKVSTPTPVTYTAVKSTDAGSGITVSTDGEGNQVTHFDLQDSSNQYLAIIYRIEASNDVTTRFDMDNYTSGKMWDAKFKFILDGNVISSFDVESEYIDDMDEYREDLQISQGTHTVVIELSWEELSSYGTQLPQYFDLIIFNSEDNELTFTELSSAEVEVTITTYNSSFDYTLESAEKEVVKQIESKFIEKPVWWFGDKEVIISEPTHLITNAGMYFGGM